MWTSPSPSFDQVMSEFLLHFARFQVGGWKLEADFGKKEIYKVMSLKKRQSWIVSVQALLHSERSCFGTCFRVGLFILMISSKAGRQKSVFKSFGEDGGS